MRAPCPYVAERQTGGAGQVRDPCDDRLGEVWRSAGRKGGESGREEC